MERARLLADFDENRIPTGVTEVLADSDLYFPDWRTFPTLDRSRLAGWADECSRCLGASAAPLEDGERDTGHPFTIARPGSCTPDDEACPAPRSPWRTSRQTR